MYLKLGNLLGFW